MANIRLRTKFLLSLIFITTVLTGAVLFIVQNYLRNHARREIHEALHNSVVTFQQFESQRQRGLAQSAVLVADLPSLRALMTTQHAPTIQDASTDLWQLTGSDLFLLADRTGKVMALHTSAAGYSQDAAQASIMRTLQEKQSRDWWFGGGHLYAVFLQPIYFGESRDNVVLGVLAVGFEVDKQVADAVARVASCQVAFRYGKDIVVSTLLPIQQAELAARTNLMTTRESLNSEEVELGGEVFLVTTLELAPAESGPVTLTVLKSYDAETLFLQDLNRLLLGVGLVAVLAGSWLIFLISHTFTRPLADLVSGVRALEKGDFAFPLHVRSRDEVAELTTAFDGMRKSLRKSQQDLLHAERLAMIGRMASTISHDLRHPLTTILAYAEFQSEGDLDADQRKALYGEIRSSVNRMAELIASLLAFSKGQETLQLTHGEVVEALERTLCSVRIRAEFKGIQVTVVHEGATDGWFDFKKLDRAFLNLLQNACEAAPAESGKVQIIARGLDDHVEISVVDNGPGIPESIREDVFQPFVTYGKEEGTGLGLAVVQKIVRDHGGEVTVETSGKSGTTFKLILPLKRDTQPSNS
ncbi:MAG: ATP-binding protein [Terriglobia bacterium]|jgi:signal transduction histidine kinase